MLQIPATPTQPVPLPQLRTQPQPTASKIAADAQAISFVATHLSVTGVSIYSVAELVKVTGFEPGRTVNFETLSAMAGVAEALAKILPGQVQAPKDEFAGVPASAEAHAMVNWILVSNDHEDLPFAVVDKIYARVFVFNNTGQFLGDAPVLLGLERGDDGVEGIGERALSRIRPEERITPSGRFMANLALNLEGQEILWVSYEQSVSMHNLRGADPKERRPERLNSSTVLDNRISYGCINISPAFWRDVVRLAFKNQQGVVYLLPETRSMQSEFGMTLPRQP